MFLNSAVECNVINQYAECIITVGTVDFASFVHKPKKDVKKKSWTESGLRS